MMNPAPQTPHFVSPKNRYWGRRAVRGGRPISRHVVSAPGAPSWLSKARRTRSGVPALRASSTRTAGSDATRAFRCRDFSRSADGSIRADRRKARCSESLSRAWRFRRSCAPVTDEFQSVLSEVHSGPKCLTRAESSVEYIEPFPDRPREIEEVRTPRLGEPELIESLWHRTAEPLPHRFQHFVLVHQALVLRLEN